MDKVFYNAVIRDGDDKDDPSLENSILCRVLLLDLMEVPSLWSVQYRRQELDRSTKVDKIMCGPQEPIQIFQILTSTFIRVYIKTLTGKTFEIEQLSRRNTTIETLKLRIQDKEDVPPNEQRLIFEGREMGDLGTLNDYNIQNESVVDLVLRLRGGASCPLPPCPCSSFATVDLQAKQQTGRGIPAKYTWEGYTIGLNLYGLCPNKACISNTLYQNPKEVVVNAKYGVVEITGDRNKLMCPACPRQGNQPAGRFTPKNFVVSFARSLFRYKKTGANQPVRQVLMESLGLNDEYKTFEDKDKGEKTEYDCIQIITVGKDSSPFQCMKCCKACVAPGDLPHSEYFLQCGHVYHVSCAPKEQDCMICTAKMFRNIKEFTDTVGALPKLMTGNQQGLHGRNKGEGKSYSEIANLKISWTQYHDNITALLKEKEDRKKLLKKEAAE